MTEIFLSARLAGAPAGFVALLQRLGPVFVRFGRFLALRPDLVSAELRDELLLQSDEDPLPALWSEVRDLLSREVPNIDSVFQSIDPVPVSRDTLSQVHSAVTANGENVLIRVLRPGIRELARKDLRRLRVLTRLMGWSRSQVLSEPREALEEFASQLDRELDLTRGLDNVRRLGAIAGKNPLLRIPKAYPELSTPVVLTMENLGGIPLSRVLSPDRGPGPNLDGFGFDAPELAGNLLTGLLRQILQLHFYCADADPRNLLLLPGNRISFADFTDCRDLDPANSPLHVRFLNGACNTELLLLFRILEQLLLAADGPSTDKLRDDFVTESHQWLRIAPPSIGARGVHSHSSPVSNWLVAILRVVSRDGFRTPPEMLAAWRTLVTVESIANRLDRSVHLQSTGDEVLRDIALDDTFRALEPLAQRKALLELLEALRNAPEYLDQIFSELAQGRLAVNLNASEHAHTVATRDRRSKLLVTAGAAVGVAWLLGEPRLPAIASFPVQPILAAALAILYLSVAILWRRLS